MLIKSLFMGLLAGGVLLLLLSLTSLMGCASTIVYSKYTTYDYPVRLLYKYTPPSLDKYPGRQALLRRCQDHH